MRVMYVFHSEILASLNFNKNKMFPLDWKTIIQWNVLLSIFQHNYMCQKCWENTRSTWECMVILQFRGQGPDSCWKNGTDLSRSSPSFLDLDLRITIHSNVDLLFFQQSWQIWLCWQISRTTFQCMVVLQSRGQNFIIVEILWSQDLRVEHI